MTATSDATSLTARRRDRVLAAMAEADLDILVLGRQDDANYASGMHRLWTAGTRPFGAGCIVVRATGRTHVLSSWDAGLPETMRWDDLYPLTWNPRVMSGYLAAIPGLSEAARIGVDEMSPSFSRAAGRFAADADVVTADHLMAGVRRLKFDEEIDQISAACALAWMGVDAALAADDNATGAAVAAMAAAGSTIPASGPTVAIDSDAVIVDVGIMLDAYEGGVGGRFVDGVRVAAPPLVDACRAGAGHADLAAAASGPGWLVRGNGMGFEQPVIDETHGITETLEAGMVLSVSDASHRDIVAVTNSAPRVLSARPDTAEAIT